ncbi:MAG TPA: hypothetical protein VE913_08055, partial [Longimicrobium sp.]|nr:hypothetical protein [Longimicrobium sp.]
MLDRDTAEALVLEHLDWIGRVTSKACGSQGYVGSDAEDFDAFVRIKLIEDDYAAVRRFKGDSEFKTYLATIIGHQLVSYVREQRGRWRPSAAAKRAGSVGIELERMVRGGGYTLQQAGEKL